MTAREKFFVGQAIRTTDPRCCLKGQTERTGNVVGFCNDPDYVRVSWTGWKTTSSVAVHMDKIVDLS